MAEHYKIEQIEFAAKPDPILAKEMVHWGKVMGNLNMVPYVKGKGWAGNIGFRENDIIWVTSSGCIIDDIHDEDIIGIKAVDGKIYYFGNPQKKPTSEWEIYWVLFSNIPRIGAILHGHDSLALDAAEELMKYRPEEVAITETVTASGSAEFRDDILEIFTDRHFYLIGRQHGFFALGTSFNETGKLALSYRETAQKLKERE